VIRELARSALEDAGFRVVSTATVKAGIALLESVYVDVILTDLSTPGGIAGCQLAATAKDRDPNVKVICSTGDAGLIAQCPDRRRDWLLKKPYSLATLVSLSQQVKARL
jgi:CheY-like chemotaxis protein